MAVNNGQGLWQSPLHGNDWRQQAMQNAYAQQQQLWAQQQALLGQNQSHLSQPSQEEKQMATKVTSPIGVLSFPVLFEPKAPVEGAEKRYSLNLIFDEAAQKTKEYKDMVAAIEAEAKEFFGGKLPANWRHPVRKASERDYAGYEDGHTFISAWSKQKPGIVGPSREEIDLPEEVWAGQRARITLRPFGYNQAGNKGVGLGLLNVQIAKRDMPRLDGRVAATKDFDELPADETADEEIPF